MASTNPPPLHFEYGDESLILERDAIIYLRVKTTGGMKMVVAYVGNGVRLLQDHLTKGEDIDIELIPPFIQLRRENIEHVGNDMVFFSYLDSRTPLKMYCMEEGFNLIYGGEKAHQSDAKQAARHLSKAYYDRIDALSTSKGGALVKRTRLETIVGVNLEEEFELRRELQKQGSLPLWKDLGSIDFELWYQFNHPKGVFYEHFKKKRDHGKGDSGGGCTPPAQAKKSEDPGRH